jgi:hypothetical protein
MDKAMINSVRLQVSFKLPQTMSKKEATEMVRAAIEHWARANPSREFDTSTLKVIRFVVG